jgi:hypothetical protein
MTGAHKRPPDGAPAVAEATVSDGVIGRAAAETLSLIHHILASFLSRHDLQIQHAYALLS